ncbi:Oidioi.mRNA.OKI2018_I69.chr1.g825.t1.cds [Oikopleura dioica]|uniref:Oidioi.mRNA.OKI2018_I69.chr1.g825.t1.cds n=1 Tax=Oikopleura dioica TaxID=34765 RepID=A0ABN7SPQ4_OIKDI|nr:Oidioi.mRNA.OKI2018_I69.chr1.g825.t1.cds [Oikopleura dioica]
MVEDTTLTSSTEFDDQPSASSEIIEFYDSSDYTVTSKISIFDPELKQANEEVKNLQEEITELIEETIEEQNIEPIEKLKQEIIEERNREKWDMMKWITLASIIVGFLLICSTFALLIHRYQQKDRGSYEIMTPFEYQKGNREAFA